MVNTTFCKVAFTFWLAALTLAPASHLSAQPTITVLDSIVLEESGDNYLVLPAPVTPDGTGGYLIADYDQPRVLHYDREGRLIQRYGREGEGPGEWKEAWIALPWGDDQVIVFSWDPPAAHAFRRDDRTRPSASKAICCWSWIRWSAGATPRPSSGGSGLKRKAATGYH